jgi:hypothetical protein
VVLIPRSFGFGRDLGNQINAGLRPHAAQNADGLRVGHERWVMMMVGNGSDKRPEYVPCYIRVL